MGKKTIFLIILISCICLGYFYNRGFAYYDEGYILHASQRIGYGEVPYKDFEFIYTPGSIYLTWIIFKIFGESILSGRLLVLATAIFTSLLIYKILNYLVLKNKKNRRLYPHKMIKPFYFLAILIYLAWFPTHTNFPWPVVFVYPAGLAMTYLLIKRDCFFAGLISFVVFIFKQNFGAAALLTGLFYFITVEKSLKTFFKFTLGFCTGLAVFIIYLFFTKSLFPFINYFYLSTYNIVLKGALSTGFPSGAKILIYLSPGLISLAALLVSKKNNESRISAFYSLSFYLFGIRPTSDYVHLAPLIGTTGIPLIIILIFLSSSLTTFFRKSSIWKKSQNTDSKNVAISRARFVIIFIMLIFTFFGFFTALYKNYYRWDSPLIKEIYYISNPRVKIFVDAKMSQVISAFTPIVNKKSSKNDYIFSYFYAPMFYFLLNRKNPTSYISLNENTLSQYQEETLINVLEQKKTKFIITQRKEVEWNKSLIYEYIKKDYKKDVELYEFTLWEKKQNIL